MNKHDTDKIISALQSFADRLKNNPVAGTTYEGDWDTLIDAQTYLHQQQSEIGVLKKKKEHWENQYIIENKKWKFAEKSFSNLLMKAANNASPPVKELTEQAEKDIRHAVSCYFDDSTIYGYELSNRIIAILRKAQEK